MYRYLFVLLCLLTYWSCQKNITRSYFMEHPASFDPAVPKSYEDGNPCKTTEHYMPSLEYPEHTPMKYIKLNFHIVNSLDSTANFDEKTGRIFINEVMKCANSKLLRNKPMHLPLDNDTPVLPIRYQYVLTPDPNIPGDDGIYFHYDDDLYYTMNNGPKKNNFSRKPYVKYGSQKDSVMNIFVLDFPKDSLLSAGYKQNSNGVAFGSWVKVIGWHTDASDTIWLDDGKFKTPRGKWYAQKNLNHEVGHNLGLRHSWTKSDGCDDTPAHPNCFNNTTDGPCKDGWSNNFMDYNIHASAWTPCQIGTAHKNMMGMGTRSKVRAMIKSTWCTFKPDSKIVITDSIDWDGAKDMESHLEIKDGGKLTIRCRVSFPKGAKIIIHPGGQLVLDGARLYNDCGEQWDGIELLKEKKIEGEVIYGLNGAVISDVVHGTFEKPEIKE
ncbi:MAG: hypothetical protein AB8F74_12500 [Saprospiraceae bacterium]